jgi:hypothetical protein
VITCQFSILKFWNKDKLCVTFEIIYKAQQMQNVQHDIRNKTLNNATEKLTVTEVVNKLSAFKEAEWSYAGLQESVTALHVYLASD